MDVNEKVVALIDLIVGGSSHGFCHRSSRAAREFVYAKHNRARDSAASFVFYEHSANLPYNLYNEIFERHGVFLFL